MDIAVDDFVKVWWDAPPGATGWVPRLSKGKFRVVSVCGETITVYPDYPKWNDEPFSPARWVRVPAPVRRQTEPRLSGWARREIARLMEKDD